MRHCELQRGYKRAAGVSFEDRQDLPGHKSERMTTIEYLRFDPQAQQLELEPFGCQPMNPDQTLIEYSAPAGYMPLNCPWCVRLTGNSARPLRRCTVICPLSSRTMRSI